MLVGWPKLVIYFIIKYVSDISTCAVNRNLPRNYINQGEIRVWREYQLFLPVMAKTKLNIDMFFQME